MDMFSKEIYVRRRRVLIDKMTAMLPEGNRGIVLFIGNVVRIALGYIISDLMNQDMQRFWIWIAGMRLFLPMMWRLGILSGWDLNRPYNLWQRVSG